MTDIFIVGAGLSGMTAAIYAKRAGYTVKIIEKYIYGGQIVQTNDIENYPGFSHIDGPSLAMKLNEQLSSLDIRISTEELKSFKKEDGYISLKTDKDEYKAKTLIIATGSKPRTLSIANEERLVGKGISYCAVCDGNFYKDKIVGVVGGRNTAMISVMSLAKTAKKVYMFVRAAQLAGDNISIEKVKKLDNVEIMYNTEVEEIQGDKKLESLIVDNNGDKQTIIIDGLFMAIGSLANLDFINDSLKTDDFGYLLTDEKMKTNIDGIYASGDCRSKEIRQITTAVSDGTIAALSAVDYIEKTDFK